MGFVVLCFVLFLFGGNCAPIDGEEELLTEESQIPAEAETEENGITQRNLQDTPQSNTEKNPVQQWFESLSKNASTNAQNAMNTFKEWITNVAQNQNGGIPAVQNTPTMYMGSFQLLKMPMPQIGDVIKGMGDLATLAQTFNKVSGSSGFLPQGIPLVSQGLQG